MWLLGHIALGYFSAIIVNNYYKEKLYIPLIFLFSILPDVDVLFRRLIQHRGPTHSIIIPILIVVPFFLIFKKGLPYFASLASHTLIGDFFVPPEKLLWPISNQWFGVASSLQLDGVAETLVEVTLFSLCLIHIYLTSIRKPGLATFTLPNL
jgi:membrane-bound metal-dependent hydrolase YbcI (DUF457 family)